APITVGSNTKLDPTETEVLPLLMGSLWPPPLKSPVALPQVKVSPALPLRSLALGVHAEDDWPTRIDLKLWVVVTLIVSARAAPAPEASSAITEVAEARVDFTRSSYISRSHKSGVIFCFNGSICEVVPATKASASTGAHSIPSENS